MVYKLPSGSHQESSKNNSFWTDANGRQYLKRTINSRESYNVSQKDFDVEFASANYYPITSGISIDGRSPDEWMDVLIDRAQGATSLSPDEIEIMVHRRLKHDDNRGDEVGTVRYQNFMRQFSNVFPFRRCRRKLGRTAVWKRSGCQRKTPCSTWKVI